MLTTNASYQLSIKIFVIFLCVSLVRYTTEKQSNTVNESAIFAHMLT